MERWLYTSSSFLFYPLCRFFSSAVPYSLPAFLDGCFHYYLMCVGFSKYCNYNCCLLWVSFFSPIISQLATFQPLFNFLWLENHARSAHSFGCLTALLFNMLLQEMLLPQHFLTALPFCYITKYNCNYV